MQEQPQTQTMGIHILTAEVCVRLVFVANKHYGPALKIIW